MLRALIVDKSEHFCQQVEAMLQANGFEVQLALTGQQGLEKAREKKFRLICCSDNLPDYTSSEFCSQIRSINGHDFSTLLVLTEQDNASILKKSLLAGATDVFSKHDQHELETYLKRLSQRETRQLSGRVLFIEDSRVLQTIIIDLLTDMGLDVDAYNYAESAWEAFQGGDYDLVITDIMLEGVMSGISLVRKIRRMKSEYGNIPIIATSGFDNISRKIELFHLGVNDYVSKPIVREELRQRVFNHVTSYQNFRELQTQQKSLHSLAMLDETTGLFNRHALREFSGKYFSEAKRFDHALSMAVIDIDHMQEINSGYSYQRGDQMLSELGTWLKRHTRDVDMIARWAGDEMVLILPGCDVDAAFVIMERMLTNLKRYKPAGIEVSMSIGVAQMCKGESETLNTLFELADRAMYQAKMSGRACVVRYLPETATEDDSV